MQFARTRSERLLGFGLIALFVLLGGYFFAYIPAKFTYLIHRIESATNGSEEKAALELANRWAGFWEIHAHDPSSGKLITNQGMATAMINDPSVSIDLHIEWLDINPYGKGPYRARRTLANKKNLYLFFGEASDGK